MRKISMIIVGETGYSCKSVRL